MRTAARHLPTLITRHPALRRRSPNWSCLGWTGFAVLGLLVVLSASPFVPGARGASASPPDRMTYQGFLVDQNNNPLAKDNPANFLTTFRIYNESEGGTRLWQEQQWVTVNQGNFSVILGEGLNPDTGSKDSLPEVFRGETASERFLEITVRIGESDVTLAPRLRLLPAPYAFLATQAAQLVDASGKAYVSQIGGETTINGTLRVDSIVVTNLSAQLRSDQIPSTLEGGRTFTGDVKFGGKVGIGLGNRTPATALDLRSTSGGEWHALTVRGHQGTDALVGGTLADYATIAARSDALNAWRPLVLNANATNFQGGNVIVPVRLGVSTFNPQANLHVIGESGKQLRVELGGQTSPLYWDIYTERLDPGAAGGRTSGDLIFQPNNTSGVYFLIQKNGSYGGSSDGRLKKDIEPIPPVLDRVRELRPVSFRFKTTPDDAPKTLGFVAQEVEPLFPEIVDSRRPTKIMFSHMLIPVAISAIQEVDREVTALRREVTRLTTLEKEAARVAGLEADIRSLHGQLEDQRQANARFEARLNTLQVLLEAAYGGGSHHPEVAAVRSEP